MEYRETRNDEQEIDLKDLLFNILYKWRSLLGAAVLVGVLAMGYAAQYNAALPEKRQAYRNSWMNRSSFWEHWERGSRRTRYRRR